VANRLAHGLAMNAKRKVDQAVARPPSTERIGLTCVEERVPSL
jgi:hypothetical protein